MSITKKVRPNLNSIRSIFRVFKKVLLYIPRWKRKEHGVLYSFDRKEERNQLKVLKEDGRMQDSPTRDGFWKGSSIYSLFFLFFFVPITTRMVLFGVNG